MPAATCVVIIAFIGVATASVGTRQNAPSAGLVGAQASAVPQEAPRHELVPRAQGVPPTWQVREAALEAASLAPTGLGLPSGAYSQVTRAVTSVTTGLYPAGEAALIQLRYQLADGREVALARMAGSDALRDLSPLAYTTAIVRLRGASARLMTGRETGHPTVLAWNEGTRSYQLSSAALSAAELIAVAEQLR
ncbi:hypothetical protein BH18ACT12_BH18ACT12_20100 [soil metagenome]